MLPRNPICRFIRFFGQITVLRPPSRRFYTIFMTKPASEAAIPPFCINIPISNMTLHYKRLTFTQ